MNMNVPVNEIFPVVAQISPQTVAAAGTATSGYVQFVDGDHIFGHVIAGAISSSSSVTCSWVQATDDQGTSAKALTAGDFDSATFSATEDDTNKVVPAGLRSDLDLANNFTYVALRVAVTGGTNAVLAGEVRRGPASYRD
jgi:hypothetical protein